MKVRHLALAAVALVAISHVFADAPQPAPTKAPAPAREQSVLEELAAGMREIVRAVVPEISLPKIEIELPALDARAH